MRLQRRLRYWLLTLQKLFFIISRLNGVVHFCGKSIGYFLYIVNTHIFINVLLMIFAINSMKLLCLLVLTLMFTMTWLVVSVLLCVFWL